MHPSPCRCGPSPKGGAVVLADGCPSMPHAEHLLTFLMILSSEICWPTCRGARVKPALHTQIPDFWYGHPGEGAHKNECVHPQMSHLKIMDTTLFPSGSTTSEIILPPVITLKLDNKFLGYVKSRPLKGGSYNTLEALPDFDGTKPESQFRTERLPSEDGVNIYAFSSLVADNAYLFVNDIYGLSFAIFGTHVGGAGSATPERAKFKVFANGNKIALLPYLSGPQPYFLCVYYWKSFPSIAPNTPAINQWSLMEIGEPILKKEIINIKYDTSKAETTEATPEVALSTRVENRGTADIVQTLHFEYTKSVVGTWNNSAGVEIGVATSIKTGIPFLAEGQISMSTTTSYSHEWGGSKCEEKKVSSSTQVSVPAKTTGRAKVIVKKALISVPFSYTERRTYFNGKVEDRLVTTGLYQNVESYHVDVEAYDFQPV
jgi:hypothetical protein